MYSNITKISLNGKSLYTARSCIEFKELSNKSFAAILRQFSQQISRLSILI
uniref:Uncharacterized protein n=1 Tax=CrAss-like virus sp. ctWDt29 TaxID=2825836 RepID=A0A8S5NVY7_9CAUD|nr:MAG TPA: hypothetical protein [CrAss-like virus sp. ctWDt29]